ncbi:TA2R9 protein, partial [Formicarius rufipectus]|nr:TA2R9 protein [Formicarius rufipectus]
SPQQANGTSYAAIAVAIVTLEGFAGMWINAFIVSMICMAWVKKKTLNSNEKILLLLACSRVWYLCISCLYYFFSAVYPYYLYVQSLLPLVLTIHTSLNCLNVWVSACLCVFYCIKIANFRNSFFIYLKVKIDRIVPWLLLGSLLFSLLIGILVYNFTENALCKNINFTCQGRIWTSTIKMDEHFFPVYFMNGFGFAASFATVIISALLLLFSLWRHKRNMQTNSKKDLSMDAHIKAMKSILSFLVMYSINFIILILTQTYTIWKRNLMMFLIYVFLCGFPSVHSLIIIFSNPKMEKSMLMFLSCVKSKVCMK